MAGYFDLCSGVQHVFNEDAISGARIVNKDMSNGTYQFPVLDDGRAGHECVKYRTKLFYEIFEKISNSIEKCLLSVWHVKADTLPYPNKGRVIHFRMLDL